MNRTDECEPARHVCDETCVCPIHGTALFYSAHLDDHACQDITCVHGHGMSGVIHALPCGLWTTGRMDP